MCYVILFPTDYQPKKPGFSQPSSNHEITRRNRVFAPTTINRKNPVSRNHPENHEITRRNRVFAPTTINRKNPVSRNHPENHEITRRNRVFAPRLSTEKTRFLATILKITRRNRVFAPTTINRKTRFQPPIPLTQRQGDRKFRPFSHHRVTTQTAAVGFCHNLPTDRQSQPGPFSNSFCSE
jgi:hypothetical protein